MEAGQVTVNRLPDDFKVYLEVAVTGGIAHLVGERQGQFGVTRSKLSRHPGPFS